MSVIATGILNASLSDRVASAILRSLRQDGVTAGQPVPSERRLAEQLNVARGTVRAALEQLERNGSLHRDGQRRRLATTGQAGAGVLCNTIAVLTRDHDYSRNDWLEMVEYGAVQAIRDRHLHSMVLHIEKLASDQSLARFLHDPPMGLVACATIYKRPDWQRIVGQFAEAGCRVVLEGTRSHDLPSAYSVGSDHAAGAAALTDLLLQRGRQRIVGYYPNENRCAYWVEQRIVGHERAMRAAGLEPMPAVLVHPLVHDDCKRTDHQAHAIQALGYLVDYRNRHGGFDAIMAASDANVPHLYEACQLMGLEPGKDVLVTGYDNYWDSSRQGSFGHPAPVATVDKLGEEVGQQMVRCIVDPPRKLPTDQLILVEPRVIEHDTQA